MNIETGEESTLEILKQHVDALSEHFDSVRIFCTTHDGNLEATKTFTLGAGNFYAQYGQIMEWIIQMDEQTRDEAIEIEEDNDEED